jgi:hypothetical protein
MVTALASRSTETTPPEGETMGLLTFIKSAGETLREGHGEAATRRSRKRRPGSERGQPGGRRTILALREDAKPRHQAITITFDGASGR